jgi:hypothetical protein
MSVIKFFGMMLMWIGGLIVTIAGPCTLFVVFSALAKGNFGAVEMGLMFGGIPALFGLGLIGLGKVLCGGVGHNDDPYKEARERLYRENEERRKNASLMKQDERLYRENEERRKNARLMQQDGSDEKSTE